MKCRVTTKLLYFSNGRKKDDFSNQNDELRKFPQIVSFSEKMVKNLLTICGKQLYFEKSYKSCLHAGVSAVTLLGIICRSAFPKARDSRVHFDHGENIKIRSDLTEG